MHAKFEQNLLKNFEYVNVYQYHSQMTIQCITSRIGIFFLQFFIDQFTKRTLKYI